MPISIQVTRGLLTPEGERTIVGRIARALLQAHGLQDNVFMRDNVIGHLVITSPGDSYVGAGPGSLAVIEVKVPAVAFRDRASQEGFVAEATRIVQELSAGDHPATRTYVNVVHAVDGTWGIAGRAYTNAELGAALAGAAGSGR